MVNHSSHLDLIFASLAHPIRRDILHRCLKAEMSVNVLAEPYGISVAAISKHIKMLELACLVEKRRRGKNQFVRTAEPAFRRAYRYVESYEKYWLSKPEQRHAYVLKIPR